MHRMRATSPSLRVTANNHQPQKKLAFLAPDIVCAILEGRRRCVDHLQDLGGCGLGRTAAERGIVRQAEAKPRPG
jgi:hypothetical protein